MRLEAVDLLPGVSQGALDGEKPNIRASGSPERSGSWSLAAPDGAYSGVIAWASGEAWFDALMDTLRTAAGEEARRRAKVAPDTLLRVARADWMSADVATGRGVATAHETVADDLGMSSKTVQRSRGLLEALGFAVTIVEGRYLTVAERRAARETHGGYQLRAASLRALTMPRPSQPVQNVHLPRRGKRMLSTHLLKNSPTRAGARRTGAPRPSPNTTKSPNPPARRSAHPGTPRPLPLQRLAAELVRRVRWLDTGRHLGALCDVLDMAGVDGERWSAGALIETMDRFTAERRLKHPGEARNPLGFLRWMLTAAIDPGELTPDERRAERDAERRDRIEHQVREREQEQRRIASIDHAEIDRILARSNAEIARLKAEGADRIERERRDRIAREDAARRARIRTAAAAARRGRL